MLELLETPLTGQVFTNEAGDARYIDAAGTGEGGARGPEETAYTLLLARGDANLEDASAFRALVRDNAAQGIALSVKKTGDQLLIDGVSNTFGMLRAPSVRFEIRGQSGPDAREYVFGALGIDVFKVRVVSRPGAVLPAEAQTAIAGDDFNNPALLASVGQGLQALADVLAPVAPLASEYFTGILK